MSQTILSGENALVTRTLKQADGSALLFSALTGAKVELRQNGGAVLTKTLGTDPELHAGAETDEITLEITEAMRAALTDYNSVELWWWTTTADAAFTQDSSTHKDWAHDPDIDVFYLA